MLSTRLAAHPCFTLLYLPTYDSRANPIERAFDDVRDRGMALIIVTPPLSKHALTDGGAAVLGVGALTMGGDVIKAAWQNRTIPNVTERKIELSHSITEQHHIVECERSNSRGIDRDL